MAAVWAGLAGEVCQAVLAQNKRLEDTYRADPGRVEQDANIERSIAEGAYAQRQLFELIQNAADAVRGTTGGRVEVVLAGRTLYAANSGEPLSVKGVETLMATHRSAKRDEQIGRFGLGFKSTLAVTDTPMILSRSGSLRFDRKRSEDELRRIVPGAAHYPAARMAWPVEPAEMRKDDPVLDSLMKWASTVVVLPVTAHLEVLQHSMRNFPAEFLLFSPQVTRLDLDDRIAGAGRQITLTQERDGAYVLNNAGKKATWVVCTKRHDPGKAALADGGYHAARETLEVSWAAPIQGAPITVGTFWAYFPTTSYTTLSGIVNAPWKLAEDRETLLGGAFNEELLTTVLPSLVATALPSVYRPDRPMAVLDVLPARGKESRNWADDKINQPVIQAVGTIPCLPTLANTLGHPRRVNLHPEGLQESELQIWASACPDPELWVHHDVQSQERRSKAARLLGLHQRTAVSVKEWVEHLVKAPTVEGSAAAVRLVAALSGRSPALRDELSRAKVLLLEDGSLAPCRRGQVFMPGGTREPGRLFIDPALAGIPAVSEALGRLGIELYNSAGALQSELASRPVNWDKVWLSARQLPLEEAETIFRDELGSGLLRDLRVRARSSRWKSPGEVYLPGVVVPGDGSRDPDFVVDSRYHAQDIELLQRLGLVAQPRFSHHAPKEAWWDAAVSEAKDAYRRKFDQSRLADEAIEVEAGRIPWPIEPLSQLSPAGKAALTQALLTELSGDEEWRLTLRGTGRQSMRIVDPVWRFARRHGYLPTQAGHQPVSRCLAWDPAASVIDGVEQPLPYVGPAVTSAQAGALRLKAEPVDLSHADWTALFGQAGGWEDARRFLLYAWGAYCEVPAPRTIKVARGRGFVEVAPRDAAVTTDGETFESLVQAQVPALMVAEADDAARLMERWGLADGRDMLVETVEFETSGEPYVAFDQFPPLGLVGHLPDKARRVVVQPCSRLEILTSTPGGQTTRPLTQRLEDEVLYTTAVDERAVINAIGAAYGVLLNPTRILEQMERSRRNKLRQQILEEEDVLLKLVLAVGAEALRRSVPAEALEGLRASSEDMVSDREIARLAMAVEGYDVLRQHSKALEARGLEPPRAWAAQGPARKWVKELGFPVEFAGFEDQPRAAEVEVEGPPVLGALHDYQKDLAVKIRGLVSLTAETKRGLLYLPTGAGKTRIAVQALVEHLNDCDTGRRIVWLAESDELCEQATQTWLQVWRALGTPGTPLTISRLWGANEVTEKDGHQVVVATLAKLDSCIARGEEVWKEQYGWLPRPEIIVVDEAHKSVAQQYNRVFSALGEAARTADITVPLLGLTATPYRGFNEVETEILVGRYHRNRLTDGVFPGDDVYASLQERGVLARIRHKELQGADLVLTDDEKATVDKFRRLPDTAESRLAQDADRNAAIVDAVLELAPDERALLFATSVQSARVLAAMLTYRGVEARAVSGTTDPRQRRRYVQEFRDGKIRVLTNYSVFTEGFDVPGIDAVFITRPTFSPNVYQQMVGRGLRGPLNGGKDEVLIVNVADNLVNFQEQFAFRHFDHLWGASTS